LLSGGAAAAAGIGFAPVLPDEGKPKFELVIEK
jgi:hypothetical protein